jgi:hypothetical protein
MFSVDATRPFTSVDQEYLAVRLQRAQDFARVLAEDAVQDRAVGALLDEARDFARVHRKALPVDDRAGRVRNREHVPLLGERGLAGYHLRQGRRGVGRAKAGRNEQRHVAALENIHHHFLIP